MWLQIFDVEHGACALLTADNGARLMIDCGHNATTGWKPGSHLRAAHTRSLEMLAITNYDEDHASGAPNLFDLIDVQWLLRNVSVSSRIIGHLKSDDGMGPGIDRLFAEIDARFSPGGRPSRSTTGPFFEGLQYRAFSSPYPTFDDENNLSMALFLQCHGVGVMFPGDLEGPGFRALLDNPAFQLALLQTNVFVASHHGRENGCCDDIVPFLRKVKFVVISDKGYQYETQRTLPFYEGIAQGGRYGNVIRRVLTTRRDGDITFEFTPNAWRVAA